MGIEDEKSLSQSFVAWDKKLMNVSQEEAGHGQWLMLKTFFYHCNLHIFDYIYLIPTHTSFPDFLHFIIRTLRPRSMCSPFFTSPMTSRRVQCI